MRKCPKCSSTNYMTERRPDGDSTCEACDYKGKTTEFDGVKLKASFETLGDRLKSQEGDYEKIIPVSEHIIIRIDGHKFSKYTKGFKRPFDTILSKAMELTTKALVKEFKAVTGYTQSDEITLVIPSPTPKKVHYNKLPSQDINHDYSGRVQKIASLTAGFATMVFNIAIDSELEDYYSVSRMNAKNGELSVEQEDYIEILDTKLGKAWFDSRVYGVTSDIEAFNSVLWRVRDAEKNSRSMFAQEYCSHKELQNLTGKEQVIFCKEKTGRDWELIEDRYKYGILVKKEKYGKPADELDAKSKSSTRTRVVSYSEHLTFSDEAVQKIMSKYKGK